MADASEDLPQRDPEVGAVELIAVRAGNPGPMTLTGTVSYILRDQDQVWVIDPGPEDPEDTSRICWWPAVRRRGRWGSS